MNDALGRYKSAARRHPTVNPFDHAARSRMVTAGMAESLELAVIGTGPFGLSIAVHLPSLAPRAEQCIRCLKQDRCKAWPRRSGGQ